MTRIRRLVLPAALLLPLALTACGTEKAGGSAPPRSELEARAKHAQLTLDHVYVTEVDGFALAKQSVGVYGADGFMSVYTGKDGKRFQLDVEKDRGGPKGYKTDGSGGHEFQRPPKDGLVVRISAGLTSVDRATLEKAARAAHPADDEELDEILPEAGEGGDGAPTGRGDLPPNGDGAPVDPQGASG